MKAWKMFIFSQIHLIGVNFNHQKSLEIFDMNLADKIWSKKGLPSCQLGLRENFMSNQKDP